MARLALVVLLIIVAYLIYNTLRISYARSIGFAAVEKATAYQRAEGSKKILVIGDSTAVGVGASTPAGSTAGLFASKYPSFAVENRAVSGAKLEGARQQLREAGERYDRILIQAGANDVIYGTRASDARSSLVKLFAEARAKSNSVTYLCCGNVGRVPVFFWPLSTYMTYRAHAYLEEAQKVAKENGVTFVNLWFPPESDPFEKDKSLYAPDGLHLSDGGYKVWFSEIERQSAHTTQGL